MFALRLCSKANLLLEWIHRRLSHFQIQLRAFFQWIWPSAHCLHPLVAHRIEQLYSLDSAQYSHDKVLKCDSKCVWSYSIHQCNTYYIIATWCKTVVPGLIFIFLSKSPSTKTIYFSRCALGLERAVGPVNNSLVFYNNYRSNIIISMIIIQSIIPHPSI